MDDFLTNLGDDRWFVNGIDGNNKAKYFVCPLFIFFGLLCCGVFYATGMRRGFSVDSLFGIFLGIVSVLLAVRTIIHSRYIIIDRLNKSLDVYDSYLKYARRKTYDFADVSEIKITRPDSLGLLSAVEISLDSARPLRVSVFRENEKAQRLKEELTNLIT